MYPKDFTKEFLFRSSRSSGSGGQHVNKVETRMELLFDLANSDLLTEEEKTLLTERWAHRLSKAGVLRLVCQKSRSQYKNKQKVIAKFYELLEKGLLLKKTRKAPRTNALAKAKRLAAKKQRSALKSARKKVELPG